MECSECGESLLSWPHDEKNRAGHFFNAGRSIIAARDDLRTERPVIPPKIVREKPAMPTLQDYKWWVRSYRRQRIIRDLLAQRLAIHEAALEQVTLDAYPRKEVAAMVLTPEIAGELREMVTQLHAKIEIRKRVAPVPAMDAVIVQPAQIVLRPRKQVDHTDRILLAVRGKG